MLSSAADRAAEERRAKARYERRARNIARHLLANFAGLSLDNVHDRATLARWIAAGCPGAEI